MVLTPSNMLPLGTKAPEFTLPDAMSGKQISLSDCQSKIATVIMFVCNHCPYVQHIQEGMVALAHEYSAKSINFVAISSNDAETYPEDSFEAMQRLAQKWSYKFPYLYDESQTVAKSYQAACTPEFYVFDATLALVYRGQFDEARPNNSIAITGSDVRSALEAILAGQKPNPDQKPSIGCNIKWKS